MKCFVKSLGQVGFRFQLANTIIYIDPYLSNSVQKQEGQDLYRLIPIFLEPKSIDDADYVLITHEHLDHCDPDTLIPLSQSSPQCYFICPNRVKNILLELGINSERIILACQEKIGLNLNIHIIPIPSAHPDIVLDEDKCWRYLGYVIEFSGKRIYHAGDTSVADEIIHRLQQIGKIDVAFLPVNEKNFYRDKRGIIGNMSIREAFQMAIDIGVQRLALYFLVTPNHYSPFSPKIIKKKKA